VYVFVNSSAGSFCISIPRNIFNRICDWYTEKCGEEFWNQVGVYEQKDFHPDWEIQASSNLEDARLPDSIRHLVEVRMSGTHDAAQGVMWFRAGDFGKIVQWYNAEYEEQVAA
jgi:hypothetical protein